MDGKANMHAYMHVRLHVPTIVNPARARALTFVE